MNQNSLLIRNKDDIYNKSNTSVSFSVAVPHVATLDSEEPRLVLGKVKGNRVTVRELQNADSVYLYNEKTNHILKEGDTVDAFEQEYQVLFDPRVDRYIVDYYDDQVFHMYGELLHVKLNGRLTSDYLIYNGELVLSNTAMNRANNVVEIVCYSEQTDKQVKLEYLEYDTDTKEETMLVAFGDAPLVNELELYTNKKFGIRNNTIKYACGGNLTLQVVEFKDMHNYDDLEDKLVLVEVRNEEKVKKYYNCRVRKTGASVELESNNVSYDITYGYMEVCDA